MAQAEGFLLHSLLSRDLINTLVLLFLWEGRGIRVFTRPFAIKNPSYYLKCAFCRPASAFTLVELLISIVIVGVLLSLILFSFDGVRARVEVANCMANLRSISIALSAQLADTKRWPQVPEGIDEAGYARFWRQTLAPYGVDSKVWRCPTAKRTVQRTGEEELVEIDYTPAEFDEMESTPFKYQNQPWVVEAGDFHGDGNLLITTSGETISFNEFYRRQTGSKPPWAK